MQLSQFTDYSLRTLMYLSAHPARTVSVAEVAERYDLSLHHLAKVSQRLVKEGWVETVRGRGGGMRLALDPSALPVGEVVRRLESTVLVECFDSSRDSCRLSGACGLEQALHRALGAFLQELDHLTLAELVSPKPTLVLLRAVGDS